MGWALAWVLVTWLGTGPYRCEAELFRIARNTNANVVAYELRRTPAGVVADDDPIHPVWIMLAEDGRREELSDLERALAYGVEIVPGDGTQWVLRARPDLPIRLETVRGCTVARTRIAGREAVLRLVVVEVRGGLIPSVQHVDVLGFDAETGADVRERFVASD